MAFFLSLLRFTFRAAASARHMRHTRHTRHSEFLVTVCSTTWLLEQRIFVLRFTRLMEDSNIEAPVNLSLKIGSPKILIDSMVYRHFSNKKSKKNWPSVRWYRLLHQQDGTTVVLQVGNHSWGVSFWKETGLVLDFSTFKFETNENPKWPFNSLRRLFEV